MQWKGWEHHQWQEAEKCPLLVMTEFLEPFEPDIKPHLHGKLFLILSFTKGDTIHSILWINTDFLGSVPAINIISQGLKFYQNRHFKLMCQVVDNPEINTVDTTRYHIHHIFSEKLI